MHFLYISIKHPTNIRKLKKSDPSRSFKLQMQHNSSPSQSHVAHLRVLAGITFHFQSTGTKILRHCQVLPHCLSKEKIYQREGLRSCGLYGQHSPLHVTEARLRQLSLHYMLTYPKNLRVPVIKNLEIPTCKIWAVWVNRKPL